MADREVVEARTGIEAKANGAQAPNASEAKPIIASIRTGLSDEDSSIMRRVPADYSDRTVRDLLAYIVGTEMKGRERETAESLRTELGAAGSVVVINGKNAKLTDKVEVYCAKRSKKVGDKKVEYLGLDIEVSAVQQGGYRI